jgi:FAD/FMN-containing dehydrogenase
MSAPLLNGSLLAALSRIVGRQWVRHRRAELVTYAMDGLPTHESLPGVVVMPGSPQEVREIVRLLSLVSPGEHWRTRRQCW